jgi:hypothetical protein
MKVAKKIGWRTRLGILLVILSAIFYTIQYLIFQDSHAVTFYIGIDLAFLPIEVLVVVLVIETAISEREKSILLEKLNMVIGAFFSEVGTSLLVDLTQLDPKIGKMRETLQVRANWSENDFLKAKENIKDYNYHLDIDGGNQDSVDFLEETKRFLVEKRKFLLTLLENPNLLEHETFTELLYAVFHLMEELEHRPDLKQLPRADYLHLANDTTRVYGLLIQEWLHYMEHLLKYYPYLFSLAMRLNPFNPHARVQFSD